MVDGYFANSITLGSGILVSITFISSGPTQHITQNSMVSNFLLQLQNFPPNRKENIHTQKIYKVVQWGPLHLLKCVLCPKWLLPEIWYFQIYSQSCQKFFFLIHQSFLIALDVTLLCSTKSLKSTLFQTNMFIYQNL